ncbi:LysR family transcriptional regulator [Rhodococcus sp. KBS0724]|uniref:LysR family transcriptional regulator n=1 Tax=Rhodococcus sp. KBS0724 TaxID=1179674 RepID=UPI00163D7A11|nr:LysR family transcriptional regulator [Rhodococcus sp. KBS0724]
MDLRALTYFVAVAKHGSVSAAALDCSVSQPAISRQIATMERKMKIRLFRRTAAGMRLTPAGARLRELASDILIRSDRATEVMRTLYEGQPSFHVASPETTFNFFIAPFIAATGAPIVDIRAERPADVYNTLSDGIDLAVGTSPPPPHLASLRLIDTPIMVQFPEIPDWATENGAVDLETIAGRQIIMPGYGSAVERTVVEHAVARGLDLTFSGTTSTGTMAQALAASGRGSALVIEPAQHDLRHAFLFSEGTPLAVTLYAAWETEHYLTETIQTIARELAEWMPRRQTVTAPTL